jgi:hypothetical protein
LAAPRRQNNFQRIPDPVVALQALGGARLILATAANSKATR